MLTTQTEALKMAIEALENIDNWLPTIGQRGLRDYEADALQACKEALEQEEPFISFSQKEWMNQIALAYQAGKDSK